MKACAVYAIRLPQPEGRRRTEDSLQPMPPRRWIREGSGGFTLQPRMAMKFTKYREALEVAAELTPRLAHYFPAGHRKDHLVVERVDR